MITRQEFETLLVAGGTGTTFFGKEEDYSLDTRILFETFAGNTMMNVA